MSIQRFEFEGQMMTVAEICSLVPAFTDSTIRFHLRNGRNTKKAMLQFNASAARSAGARRGKIKGWKKNQPFHFLGKKNRE